LIQKRYNLQKTKNRVVLQIHGKIECYKTDNHDDRFGRQYLVQHVNDCHLQRKKGATAICSPLKEAEAKWPLIEAQFSHHKLKAISRKKQLLECFKFSIFFYLGVPATGRRVFRFYLFVRTSQKG
jgi:hypothetical protein